MVDTISGLASADYRHDEWGVDVTVSGSQKGLMLPPGISFNALVAQGARGQQDARSCRKAFWAWDEIVEMNKSGYWPYTPSTNLLYGLHEALDMLLGAGPGRGLRAPPALGRGVRGAVQRLGSADPVRRPGGVFAGADRRRHARRRRRRRACAS